MDSVDLQGVDFWGSFPGDLYIKADLWLGILTVAQWNGWCPAGTEPPENDSDDDLPRAWDGSYFPACGQSISEPDAKALSAALKKALLDIPDHNARPRASTKARKSARRRRTAVREQNCNPLQVLSGWNKKVDLMWFIRFCDKYSEGGGLLMI